MAETLARQVVDLVHRSTGLESLAACRQVQTEVDTEISFHVHNARIEGASWDEIGAALGMTRQAAHKRFA